MNGERGWQFTTVFAGVCESKQLRFLPPTIMGRSDWNSFTMRRCEFLRTRLLNSGGAIQNHFAVVPTTSHCLIHYRSRNFALFLAQHLWIPGRNISPWLLAWEITKTPECFSLRSCPRLLAASHIKESVCSSEYSFLSLFLIHFSSYNIE